MRRMGGWAMAKKIKAKAPRSVAAKDLEPKDAKDVQGAGKAVTGQPQTYMEVKLENLQVSSYQ